MEELRIANSEVTAGSQEQKESMEQPFDKEIIDSLNNYCENLENEQRREFADQPDMLSKLNVHFPTVWHVAKQMDPENKTLHLAARFHDYGRAVQFRKSGTFNDGTLGSEFDHHVLGEQAFTDDALAVLAGAVPEMALVESERSGVLLAVQSTIKLHGMKGKAFSEDFAELEAKHPEIAEIVDKVSVIDDIANGTQCVNYLLREGQEWAKNVSKGGFIPDENATSKDVTPHVMELLRDATSFNRNAECKTYPDYYLFGAFLAARNLKNPKTRDLTLEAMNMPVMMMSYAAKKEMVDGEEKTVNVLVSESFPNTMEAFKHLFESEINPDDAKEAYSILENYYKYGTPDNPEQKQG